VIVDPGSVGRLWLELDTRLVLAAGIVGKSEELPGGRWRPGGGTGKMRGGEHLWISLIVAGGALRGAPSCLWSDLASWMIP